MYPSSNTKIRAIRHHPCRIAPWQTAAPERQELSGEPRCALRGLDAQARDDLAVLAGADGGAERTLEIDGAFIAIGHKPNSELVADQVEVDGEGYVQVDGRSSRTNVAGVFAAGDLIDNTYRQAITAAGSGCAAALDAEAYLRDAPIDAEAHWEPDPAKAEAAAERAAAG